MSRKFLSRNFLSRRMRSLIVAIALGVISNTAVSTAFAPVVHADTVDCSQDENKAVDECKK